MKGTWDLEVGGVLVTGVTLNIEQDNLMVEL